MRKVKMTMTIDMFFSKIFVIFVYLSDKFKTVFQMQKVTLTRKCGAQTFVQLGIKERIAWIWLCHCMVIVTFTRNLFWFPKALVERRGWLLSTSFNSYTTHPAQITILQQSLKFLTSTWRSTMMLTGKVVFLQINPFFNTSDAIETQSHFFARALFLSLHKVLSYVACRMKKNIWLDLLSDCVAMANRSTIVRGQTLMALLWKKGNVVQFNKIEWSIN